MQVVRCTDLARQREPARVMVGMHMSVDDMGYHHARLSRLGDEPVLVAGHNVDGNSLADAGTSKEIGKGGVFSGTLAEEHDGFLCLDTGA
ncbi:hypothetical protein D3C72_2011110 [compost metagenome]